ncbi:HNH/endonuclease VII fold putative polymorphic toxin [Dickeya dadantii]|uniref:HNH/endonuclease VII fold putative polymorphic toxin n=1 Tax=Dickeya dadantii TaxID=204038 RepID=UPI001EE65478|nr:HNH/endonuclease VII fold putative polymorphic toxin [Dickeya dadantii]
MAGAAGNNGKGGSGKGDDWDAGGDCEGTREQCAVRDGTRGPGHTELPIADKDPTGGKLENPAPTENTATTLTTPDQSDNNGASHTGNTDGALSTAGNATTTPIPDGPNKDDLAYKSEGNRPENLSPEGAGRSGAFNEAKRRSGIPVSQSPDRVLPNVDKRGNSQPGKIYEFDVPKSGGGTQTIQIRDDANGHFFGERDIQNRGPHFNDQKGNHYDY